MADPTAASTLPGLFSGAAAGVDAYGTWLQGQGTAAGDQYRAQRAEQAAQYARLDATQTGAALSVRLTNALGNIDSMRAAMNTNPTSPTGAAIRDTSEQIGLGQKSIAVENKMEQARQDEADAQYLNTAAKYATMAGGIGAAGGILKAVGQAAPFAALLLA